MQLLLGQLGDDLAAKLDQMSVADLSATLLENRVWIHDFKQGLSATVSQQPEVRASCVDCAFSVELSAPKPRTEIRSADGRQRLNRVATGKGSGPTIGGAIAAALLDAQNRERA